MELNTHLSRHNSVPSLPNLSPPVVLQALQIGRVKCHVAREDLLEGGTKQRAIAPYVNDLSAEGFSHFVYASPFCGFAQVALAASACNLGFKVRIFSEHDPAESKVVSTAHAFTRLAAEFGAEVVLTKDLAAAEIAAKEFCGTSREKYKIPLGFADPGFLIHMKEKLSEQYQIVCDSIGTPKRFWLPVGSGTLAKIFAEIISPECEMVCVDVRVLKPDDSRIQFVAHLPNVRMLQAPELFHQQAELVPSTPSNLHYDAKIWRFFAQQARDGDIWWNVAR